MTAHSCLILALLAACGATTDDRPRTTEYVTKTILAGTCAQAQCHSSFRNAKGLALDTVEAVKHTVRYEIESNPKGSSLIGASTDPHGQPLDVILHRRNGDETDTGNIKGSNPMPLDSAMPEPDIQLLLEWAALGTPGACEIPAGTSICGFNGNYVVTCGEDSEYVYSEVPTGGHCP